MAIQINASQRLQASWGTNRLKDAIAGKEDALADIPKIVDDAVRNTTNSLNAYKDRIESLVDGGDTKQLKKELQALQKFLIALDK